MIAVLGTAGRLGQHVVGRAAGLGLPVAAVIHRSNPLREHPLIDVRTADVYDATEVREALVGCRVVISCLGSAASSTADVQTVGADSIATAMNARGLQRLVSVTGSGARAPGEALTPHHRVKRTQMLLGAPHLLSDGERHLAALEASGLAWTVVRVPLMTHRATGSYAVSGTAPHPATTVAYADVAAAMVDLALDPVSPWLRRAPFVTRSDSAAPSPR